MAYYAPVERVEGPMYSTQSPPPNDEYLERDIDTDLDAERPSSKVQRLRPNTAFRSSGVKNAQFRSGGPSIARRIIRTLGRFSIAVLIGVGATLVWQSYGGEMVRAWAPSLGWLVPASASAELQAQFKGGRLILPS